MLPKSNLDSAVRLLVRGHGSGDCPSIEYRVYPVLSHSLPVCIILGHCFETLRHLQLSCCCLATRKSRRHDCNRRQDCLSAACHFATLELDELLCSMARSSLCCSTHCMATYTFPGVQASICQGGALVAHFRVCPLCMCRAVAQ